MITLKQHIKRATQEQTDEVPSVIVDSIFLKEDAYNSLTDKNDFIVEAKTYFAPISGLKHYTHRIDPVYGEQKPGHQKHVHMFYDGEQLFAMNIDGTAHDGCHQVRIPDELIPFLQKKGFALPPNNIIEMVTLSKSEQLISESLTSLQVDEGVLCSSIAINAGEALRSGLPFQLVETNCTSTEVLCNSKTKGQKTQLLYTNQDIDKVKQIRDILYHTLDDYLQFDLDLIEIFDEYKYSTPHSLYIVW